MALLTVYGLPCIFGVSCLQAARVRCTVGEISDALERAWGRHAASTAVAPGFYVATRNAGATGEELLCGGGGRDDC
jgi:hypothetical protein